ncbi:unnamed protein product, partial [Urochloa humidicola]
MVFMPAATGFPDSRPYTSSGLTPSSVVIPAAASFPDWRPNPGSGLTPSSPSSSVIMPVTASLPDWRPYPGSGLIPSSPSLSVPMPTAGTGTSFPNWVLLEPFVFRRDDDESFPDDTMALIRAYGTTSWGVDIRVAFSLAEPPSISRLYAQLPEPGVPPRKMTASMVIHATHCHLALLPVTTNTSSDGLVQNFFIFRANQNNPSKSSLQLLPTCTEPEFDYYSCGDDSLHHTPSVATPCQLKIRSLGLWCSPCGCKDFVVAELTIYIPSHNPTKAFTD